jgi:hypothetical protein
MVMPTPDCRQLVPIRESRPILPLIFYPQEEMRSQRREARPDAHPVHEPSAAECYGCVEWFRY